MQEDWSGATEFLADLLVMGGVDAVFLPDKGEVVLHGKAFKGNFPQDAAGELGFDGAAVQKGNPAVMGEQADDGMHVFDFHVVDEVFGTKAMQC